MSSVPLLVSFGAATNGTTFVGMFVKVAAYPASDMTLFDFNGGSSAYFRCKMRSTGHIVLESSMFGVTASVDLTPTTVPGTGTWYWVAAAVGNVFGINGAYRLRGQVSGPGGVSDGVQSSSPSLSHSTTSFSCTLGVGVSQSTSYLGFPNTVGNEWSKFEYYQAAQDSTVGLMGTPTSDVSASGLDVLYLCRDSVGVAATLADSTSNARTLTAGTQGLTVVTDGPYP